MTYLVRFVQRFRPESRVDFLQLEKQFIALEQNTPEFPKGKRYMPFSGREPSNTLVWECEFDSLEKATDALSFLENDQRHEQLYSKQVVYFLDAYTEIYESFS